METSSNIFQGSLFLKQGMGRDAVSSCTTANIFPASCTPIPFSSFLCRNTVTATSLERNATVPKISSWQRLTAMHPWPLQEGKTIPLTSHKKNSPQTRVSVWRSLAVQTISKSVPKSNSSRVSSTPVLLHPPLWSFLKGYFETTPMKQMLTSVAWYQQCSFYSLYHCGVQQIGDNKYGNIKKYLGALPCFCWHKLRFSSSFVFMWFHRLPRNHLSPKETMEMGLAVYLKYQPPLHRSRQGSDKARQSWL